MALALALAAGGCGGSKPSVETRQQVAGGGFRFAAPDGWTVTKAQGKVTVVAPAGGEELLSVTIFPLARRYQPSFWPQVLPELDRVTEQLAAELKGTAGSGRTKTVAGRRARAYDIEYARSGTRFVERITFLLAGRREYQLLCRWRTDRPELGERACSALAVSFRLR